MFNFFDSRCTSTSSLSTLKKYVEIYTVNWKKMDRHHSLNFNNVKKEDMVVEISKEVDCRHELIFSEMSILTTPRAEDQLV